MAVLDMNWLIVSTTVSESESETTVSWIGDNATGSLSQNH